MSTVAEIEAAIQQLSAGEQRQLAQRILTRSVAPNVAGRPARKTWLSRLARLRESVATDRTSPASESILDDLRGERG